MTAVLLIVQIIVKGSIVGIQTGTGIESGIAIEIGNNAKNVMRSARMSTRKN